jgi:hypothetical protein
VEVCYEKTVGGRMGWRLPKIEELVTLVEGGGIFSGILPKATGGLLETTAAPAATNTGP